MKVTVNDNAIKVRLCDAAAGKFYQDEAGDVFFCTSETATCITACGKTWPNRHKYGNTKLVTELPAGSTITIVTD